MDILKNLLPKQKKDAGTQGCSLSKSSLILFKKKRLKTEIVQPNVLFYCSSKRSLPRKKKRWCEKRFYDMKSLLQYSTEMSSITKVGRPLVAQELERFRASEGTLSRWSRLQLMIVNIPTVSFGLSLAWISLATGTKSEEPQDAVVGGAGATHAASFIGVLLSGAHALGARDLFRQLSSRLIDVSGDKRAGSYLGQRISLAIQRGNAASLLGTLPRYDELAAALKTGRKPPLIASSAAFALCWGLKVYGGYWSILVARVLAGLAGAAAWTAAPLMGREISSGLVRGAAFAAPVLAHNLGFLLMYVAADADMPHKVILWCCLSLSLFHCLTFLFVPESPPFLAANGKLKEACASLAWLRGVPANNPDLIKEIETLPPEEDSSESPFALIRELWSDRQRRRALLLSVIAVAGQECCGLLALLQFAEQVFAEASGDLETPARNAMVLGAVQMVASAVALYLVERVGRRPLIIWTALACTGFLASGTALSWIGGSSTWLAVVLAGAVAVDSLGMQPAPYALLADMFHYRYRGCALLISTGAAAAGNALEVALFGAAATAGMHAALALATAATGAFTLFAIFALPETRNRDPEEIYDIICPLKKNKTDPEDPVISKPNNEKSRHADQDVNKRIEDFYNAIYDSPNIGNNLKKVSTNQPPEIFAVCESKHNNNNSTESLNSKDVITTIDSVNSENKHSEKTSNVTSDIPYKSDSVVNVASENSDENKKTQWTSL